MTKLTDERRAELIEKVNAYIEQHVEHNEYHVDAGDSYSHLAAEGGFTYNDGEKRLKAFCDEVESEMLADCEAFLAAHADTIRECVTARNNNSSNFTMAGHDFWLTRCGHGAGFWDGDYSEPHATILTDASGKAGNIDLYVGDDGKVYS